MAKKTAMVAPPPAKPGSIYLDLAHILADLGNNRPYTVISQGDNTWQVRFYGDDKPKTVKLVGEKWVIK